MSEKNSNGAGNLIVKMLNGIGLIGIFTAVALGAIKLSDVNRLSADVREHCKAQEAKWSVQMDVDSQQDKIVQRYNEALIRIEGKQQNMKEQLDEIKVLLKERKVQ